MSVNAELAAAFGEIAKLIEILGQDKFRAIAHDKASRIIEAYPTDLKTIVAGSGADARKRLTEIEGVGPKIADKIIEYCTKGRVQELDELRAEVPAGLLPLMQIPGLGPKTLHALWKEGGVKDLAGLKKAIESGRILELPRMGEKSVQKLKESIALAEQGETRLPLGMAMPIAEAIVAKLRSAKGVERIAFAGSLRRGKETIGDIDILVSTSDPDAVGAVFRGADDVVQVISAGETRSSVRVRIGGDAGRWGALQEGQAGPSIQVDLKIIPEASWGAALYYFTGSKDHNVAVRQRSLDRGWTLNEYGLFEDDGKAEPHKRGLKPIASRTEDDIFKALGLPFIPPELRENRGELSLKSTPRLVEVGDVRAELHAHTTESDGELIIEELAREAKHRGFHTIAVTDHSKSSVIAGGLTPERLREHIKAVRAADAWIEGISILPGSEVDILSDGSLDYDDELLAQLDVVVASPHAALSQDPATATRRLLRAIEHPMVHIIGHPTGRLINRRAGLAPDMAELFAAAKAHNVAMEINAHWMRLDLRDHHVRAAVEAGCLIAIDCDVHAVDDFDCLRYGVMTGRRGWLPPEQCINTWDKKKLHAWLRSKR
ncbi:MAG: DNA polymerase/3'-5' exonuclease PolX [Phycisphaerales bacterium]|nr:DNA polymerase/3'-5' exonuclease PolX [Phycisphaerales bacterium]